METEDPNQESSAATNADSDTNDPESEGLPDTLGVSAPLDWSDMSRALDSMISELKKSLSPSPSSPLASQRSG